MKKILFILAAIVIAAPLGAASPGGRAVKIENTKVVRAGDSVLVSFDFDTRGFQKDYRTVIVPILSNHQNRSLTLPAVTIVGKRRNISDKRVGQATGDRRVITGKSPAVMVYSISVPFEEWMQLVSVSAFQYSEGCCSQTEFPREVIADGKLLYYDPVPHFRSDPLGYELTELEQYTLDHPFLHPMEDYGRRHDILMNDRESGTASVIFKVGSAVLDQQLPQNAETLNKISKAFDLIAQDPNATLRHIIVSGYASPEGSLAFNTKLAAGRAEAVKSFLQTRMSGANDHLFEVHNGREDWDGLRKLVQGSSMEYRSEVLEILDAYTMEQEVRKTKLKQLAGGHPYRYMLENFYPSLRTAGYVQVYYEIDRTATVTTAVKNMSGKTVWIDPDDPRNRAVTAMNRAIELMLGGKFGDALALLRPYEEDARAWNLVGVCYMMTGDAANAGKFLTRAADNGDEDAIRNLRENSMVIKIERL
ncbi:OmpA family protein [Alistipes sp. OttesenSCG-928-B03]|nr:OmpA family protein [Alistipes sp. OttesenSCG-928-B03]